jgi:hypothetical protein
MGWTFQAITMPKAMQSKCNTYWCFLCLHFLILLGFFVVWWIVFVARYNWTYQGIWSHALQHIILGELNGNHLYPWAKHAKKIYISQFLSFVFWLWFLILYFYFFAFISLVLLVVYLGTDFALLSFPAIWCIYI